VCESGGEGDSEGPLRAKVVAVARAVAGARTRVGPRTRTRARVRARMSLRVRATTRDIGIPLAQPPAAGK